MDSLNEVQVVENEALGVLSEAQKLAVAIRDQDSYRSAAEFLLKIKGVRRRVEEAFEPMVTAAHRAWKESVALRKRADDPLDKAEVAIKPAMGKYLAEEEAKRQEAQRKAWAEAKRLEEEARLNAAIEAEKDGDKAGVEQILDTPAPVAPVFIPQPEKVAGVSTREVVKFEITNLRELVAGIISGAVPITAIEADMVVIGQAARAGITFPGVRVWKERTVVGRL